MKLMHSIGTAQVVQEQQGHTKWVRTVRKENPPGSLEEYLQHWEAFLTTMRLR